MENKESTEEEKIEEVKPKEEKIEKGLNEDDNIESPEDFLDEKKSKSKPIIITVIVLLLLGCLVGVGIWQKDAIVDFFNKNFKSNGDKEQVKTPKKEFFSEYRMSGNSIENFDLYFLKLENQGKNTVYSPLSIKYALAMLSEGAAGDTRKQITSVIGDYKSKKYINSKNMSFANAFFIRNSFKDAIKPEYVNSLKEKYNAEVQYEDFNSAQPMNDWVSNKTFNLIKDTFDNEAIKDENFELVNALAIDMNWINRIQCVGGELPKGMSQKIYGVYYIHEKYNDYLGCIDEYYFPKMTFNGTDTIKALEVKASFNKYDIVKDKGEENIRKIVSDDFTKYLKENPSEVEFCPTVEEYVNQYIKEINTNYRKADTSTDFYISDNENERVFAKDLQTYDGVTLQYVGIMPKKDELTTYVKNLTAKDLLSIIEKMKEVKYENFKEGVITHIKGSIPVFKYDYKLDLLEDLKKLDVKDVFDINKADLSNMLKDEKQYISSANHKATIEFSNDGIKAAAVSSAGGAGAAAACLYDYVFEVPVEEIDVTFDKPYMYIIRDKDSGEVWFVGTVYEPTK